jgi:sterol desaturase/sphingolipid hydroxylase (fatty acid hydroxylase superfamily)
VVPRNAALLAVATSLFFFLLYEWLHLSYHLPPATFIGRNPLIALLRALHQRHHDPRLMRRWNFNVTVPLFDWLHRTRWTPQRAARTERPAPAAAPLTPPE